MSLPALDSLNLQRRRAYTLHSIDGVLLRGRSPLDGASRSLSYLKDQRIPFILLTNGGGVHEEKRAQVLTEQLGVEITPSMIVQSHTPFSGLEHLKKRPTLIVGGHKDRCASVAQQSVCWLHRWCGLMLIRLLGMALSKL